MIGYEDSRAHWYLPAHLERRENPILVLCVGRNRTPLTQEPRQLLGQCCRSFRGFAVDAQTRTSIWCIGFPIRQRCWIANFKKKRRSPASRSRRASAARCAAGRPAKKTNGSAPAGTSGTHSTLEASAQLACTSGLKPSASLAPDGRSIPIGTPIRVERVLPSSARIARREQTYRDDWACLIAGAVRVFASSLLCYWEGVSNGQEEEKDAGYRREDHQAR